MAIPNYPLNPILPTDTFREWADKCNSIIDALEQTTFVTGDDGFLRATEPATITGEPWIFTKDVRFENDLSILGSQPFIISGIGTFDIGRTTNITRPLKLDSGSYGGGDILTFKNGAVEKTLGFKSSPPDAEFTLKWDHSVEVDKLYHIGDTISIDGQEYVWPKPITSTAITNPNRHFLSIDTSSSSPYDIEIEDRSLIVNEAVTASISAINDANFVLPVELIPVGTRMHVSWETIDNYFPIKTSPGPNWADGDITDHPEFDTSTKYPTWLVCDGSNITFDQTNVPDSLRYEELIQLLDPTQTGLTGNANLPNGFDETYELVLETDNTDWHVIQDVDEPVPAGHWNVNLNIKSTGALSGGWSYELIDSTDLDNEIYQLNDTTAGGIPGDREERIWDVLDITGGGGITIPTGAKAAKIRIDVTSGSSQDMRFGVGVAVDNHPDWNGIPSSNSTLPLISNNDDPKWNLDNEGSGTTTLLGTEYLAIVADGNGATTPDGKDTNQEWFDIPLLDYNGNFSTDFNLAAFFRTDQATGRAFRIKVSVQGFWVESTGGNGTTYINLNRNFLVPSNNYLHFKADDVTAGTYDISYALTSSATTPTRASGDWTVWDTVVGPTPTTYQGIVTNLNSGAMLIKAEPDSASNFLVEGGDGISITPLGPLAGSLGNAMDIYGTSDLSVKLAPTGNTFLQFDSGGLEVAPYSVSKTDGYSVNAIAGTLARRRTDTGGLRVGEPVDVDDATTKAYVDGEIAANKAKVGSTLSFAAMNYQYEESTLTIGSKRTLRQYQTISTSGIGGGPLTDIFLIDKDKTPRAWYSSENLSDHRQTKGGIRMFNSTPSNFGNGGNQVNEEVIPGSAIAFDGLLRDDDEYGMNAKEVICSSLNYMIVDEDDILYANGCNSTGILGRKVFEQRNSGSLSAGDEWSTRMIPAMIPLAWTTTDYLQIDWYVHTPPVVLRDGGTGNENSQEFIIKLKDDDSLNRYGAIIQASVNDQGQLSDGTTTPTEWFNGPMVWGPTGGWASLWQRFATDATNQATTFHFDKTDPNQWHIEKVWRGGLVSSIYVKVTKNDGSQHEIWASGANGGGQLCTGTTEDFSTASAMARVAAPCINNSNLSRGNITSATVSTAPRVWTTTSPHGLRDWDIISIPGNDEYFVRLGNTTLDAAGRGQNQTTQFRLFKTSADAFFSTNHRNPPAPSPTNIWIPRQRLGVTDANDTINNDNAVVDIAITGYSGSNDTRATTIFLLADGDVRGAGFNTNGGTGVNNTTNELTRARLATATGPGTTTNIMSGGSYVNYKLGNASTNFLIKTVDLGGGQFRKDLYGCGRTITGLLNATTDSVQRTFKRLNTDAYSVEKVFVSEAGHGLWWVGVPTGGGRNVLFAGGYGWVGYLGTGDTGGDKNLSDGDSQITDELGPHTNEYQTCIFPEDPMNIIQMADVGSASMILTKTNPTDDVGRVYFTGTDLAGIFLGANRKHSVSSFFSSFTRVDDRIAK